MMFNFFLAKGARSFYVMLLYMLLRTATADIIIIIIIIIISVNSNRTKINK